jgi:hypothetical protein
MIESALHFSLLIDDLEFHVVLDCLADDIELGVVDGDLDVLGGEEATPAPDELELPVVLLLALLAVEDDDVLEQVVVGEVVLALADAALGLAQLQVQLRHAAHELLVVPHDRVDEPVLHLDQPLLELLYQQVSALQQLLPDLPLLLLLPRLYLPQQLPDRLPRLR